MLVNNARTVSQALAQGVHWLKLGGVRQESRVGSVIVAPQPVLTVYSHPTNRVLFSPVRDANPFFHVMETLWMLAGRNDLPWLVRFNSRFAQFSDDGGKTQPGAYGYRWRNYFGHDQLQDIILELRQNPQTRRAVLAMWDGGARHTWVEGTTGKMVKDDLSQPGDFYAAIMGSADVPCNTHAYFDTIDGKLNMTVCCRSNDIIWGAYGANAVHFSFLLEYMAAMTGIPMGIYRQFSNNYHIYTSVVPEDQMMPLMRNLETTDRYLMNHPRGGMTKVLREPDLRRVPLVSTDEETWHRELDLFMIDTEIGASEDRGVYTDPFFNSVAIPIFGAYMHFKRKDYRTAIEAAELIKAEDWRIACVEWLQRREARAKMRENTHAGA